MTLTLSLAQTIVESGLVHARQAKFRPLCIVVLDARAAVIATTSADGTSLKRFEIAQGKAQGALAFNVSSRALGVMAAGLAADGG